MISKICTVVFSGMFLAFAAAAQNNAPNPARDSVINKICNCISQKGKTLTADKIESTLQECMMTVISEDPVGVMMDLGLTDFEDEAAAEKFGEQVGLELVKKCPALKEFAVQMIKSEMENKSSSGTLKGRMVKTETEPFQSVLVDENGKQQKLLILYRFDNADVLIKNDPGLKGKNISFEWKEIEIYNPKTKSFEIHKVVTGFKM